MQSSRSDREVAELRRRCEELSDFLENASVPLHRVGPDGTILWANRAELQLLGYPEAAYVGRNIAEFHADPAAVRHIMDRLQSGEPVRDFEAALRCADGSLKEVIIDSSVRWEAGRFLHTRCFLRDNTDAKRAERALRESEQRYRTLFETTIDAIAIIDGSGSLVDANESLCRILGVPRARLTGMQLSQFMEAPAAEQAAGLFEDLKNNGTFRGRFPVLNAAGEPVQLEWTARADFLPGLHLCVARDVTEQVRMEDRLKRSHERYQAFVAQSSEGIWRVELESPLDVSLPEEEQIRQFYAYAILAECNAEFAGMYGFERPEDVNGSRLERFLPPNRHNTDYLRAFIRCGYRLTDAESHERDRRGDAKYIVNQLIGVVQNGRLWRVWGTQRDITAQKRTARRLWDAQSRLALRNGILAGITSGLSAAEVVRQTVEQVHLCFPELRCGYATVDEGATRTAACSIEPEGLGTADEALVRILVPPEYLDALRRGETVIAEDLEDDSRFGAYGTALLRSGTRAALEIPLGDAAEELRVLFFHAPEPHQWSDHEITTLREVSRDLTAAIQRASEQEARRRAQEQLEASERRLRLALSAGRMVCWECSLPGGAIAYTSVPAAPSAALPAALDRMLESIHEEDRAHVAEAFRRAKAQGGAFQVEYRIAAPGGGYLWYETRAETHRDPMGNWSRIIGVSSDISERMQSEEALRHRQKLEGLGVLAGGVAHDFNNLLTGILGNATLAAEIMEQSHPARVLVDDVCLAGERAAELTRQLLAYAGKARYVLAPIDLSTLVQDTCRLIQLSIPRKATLRLDLPANLPRIDADRGQLQQIVMNLVLNAGEAVADGEIPEIRVSTRAATLDDARLRRIAPAGGLQPGPHVVLSVEDNGTGMDEATKARIFDPFFTTKATGRGLGLAAVHGIVRAHHGALAVTSAPGRGTVFEVWFPARAGAELGQAAGEAAAVRRKAVLVVDSNEQARDTAVNILTGAGYEVLAVENAAAAAQALQNTHEIGAVLLDAAIARSEPAAIGPLRPEVPVLLSGVSQQAGDPAGFVSKPFLPEILVSKIAAITDVAIAAAASADGLPIPGELRNPHSK